MMTKYFQLVLFLVLFFSGWFSQSTSTVGKARFMGCLDGMFDPNDQQSVADTDFVGTPFMQWSKLKRDDRLY
jgi:hypothetical protein